MMEVPGMMNQLSQFLKQPPPTQMDLYFAMYKFDADGNGKITYPEFRKMLYFMAGKPLPN